MESSAVEHLNSINGKHKTSEPRTHFLLRVLLHRLVDRMTVIITQRDQIHFSSAPGVLDLCSEE
jgi:hypothetical protein